MGRKAWQKDDIDFLVSNYTTLETREIAEGLGRSMGALKQQAYKLRLEKYPDDISFFTNWTEESAYVIGLWAADGYANVRPGKGVAVSISQSDEDVFLAIKALVGKGSIYYVKQHDSYRYTLYSRPLYEFFNNLFGHDVRRKSKILQWPSVPEKYVRHFIRGFCDGDGHVSVDRRGSPQIRFYCGSADFADVLLSKIADFTGIEGTTSVTKTDVHLVLYIGIKATCLARWLYTDFSIAMNRKVVAASEVMNNKQKRVNRKSLTPKMVEMFSETLSPYLERRAM